jgi:hypothetical protein
VVQVALVLGCCSAKTFISVDIFLIFIQLKKCLKIIVKLVCCYAQYECSTGSRRFQGENVQNVARMRKKTQGHDLAG